MSGADLVESALGAERREVPRVVENRHSTPDVQIITPLDLFYSKRRTCKALIPFGDIHISCRKDLYDRAADIFMNGCRAAVTYVA